MGRVDYRAMKTDPVGEDLISSDVNELKAAAKKLIKDATKLGGLGFGTSFLKWVASFAAIYLLILDRTNWRTNMLTSLLVPYIFFSLPSVLFNFLRGEVGKWIAFIAVVLRLFFPRHFPGSLILLLVVAPNFFVETLRGSWVGVLICLIIGCYLLQEHISSLGWIQELIHTKPWNIQHYWHHPSTSLSCLGFRTSLSLSSVCFHLQCKISTSIVNVITYLILTFIFF